jgi:ATP/maltotriose-dependent transcriptional regulator MalT
VLRDWRAAQGGLDTPVAWLSLDPDDNDLARFLRYLIASLRSLHDGIGACSPALALRSLLSIP